MKESAYVGSCFIAIVYYSFQDKVGKVTIMTRRKLEGVGQQYGVDVGAEETAGRLIQHVQQGLFCAIA